MSNTFGNIFRITTFGESHGAAVGGVIDGCPSKLAIDYNLLEEEMRRRHVGDGATQRNEPDRVEFLSGILDGETLGTPIAFLIRNTDPRSNDYNETDRLYRPGHADYTYMRRYGTRDWRGGGRASGRETACRVVGGAIAKMLLARLGISISSTIIHNPEPKPGDSSGGVIECVVNGLPAGIGDPVFDKLNARLATAMMSIPSATAFAMGCGDKAAWMTGKEYRDEWNQDFTTKTNHCGGVQGGISNGMPVVFRTTFHPAVTINSDITNYIDENGMIHPVTVTGRFDSNHIPRTAVVVEAMAAMTIVDLGYRKLKF